MKGHSLHSGSRKAAKDPSLEGKQEIRIFGVVSYPGGERNSSSKSPKGKEQRNYQHIVSAEPTGEQRTN